MAEWACVRNMPKCQDSLSCNSTSAGISSGVLIMNDLLNRLLGISALQITEMPEARVFHIFHAFAFDRVGDDHVWFVTGAGDVIKRLNQFGQIMTVTFMHLPIEGAPLVRQRFDAH